MRLFTRYLLLTILWLFAAAASSFLFLIARDRIAGPLLRIYILPNDYLPGSVVIQEDKEHGEHLRQTGLWHTQVKIKIPPSGNLHVQSLELVHQGIRNQVMYEDGRILASIPVLGFPRLNSSNHSEKDNPVADAGGQINYVWVNFNSVQH